LHQTSMFTMFTEVINQVKSCFLVDQSRPLVDIRDNFKFQKALASASLGRIETIKVSHGVAAESDAAVCVGVSVTMTHHKQLFIVVDGESEMHSKCVRVVQYRVASAGPRQGVSDPARSNGPYKTSQGLRGGSRVSNV